MGRLICRVRHEFRHGHTQGGGQPLDVHERDIALATFDAAYVGPMQIGKLSEFLLRDSSLLPNRTQPGAESNLNVYQGALPVTAMYFQQSA